MLWATPAARMPSPSSFWAWNLSFSLSSSASSAFFRAVITSDMMMIPPMLPATSRQGRTSHFTQSRVPSGLGNGSSSQDSVAPARQRRWIAFQRSEISGKTS